MRFEIPLADGRTVYMKDPGSALYAVVWVSSEKFLKIWDSSQKNDVARTQKKYPDIELCFAQSAHYPVHFIDGGIVRLQPALIAKINLFLIRNNYPVSFREKLAVFFKYGKRVFRFNDGITRATWLINNEAQSFPVACSPCQAEELKH